MSRSLLSLGLTALLLTLVACDGDVTLASESCTVVVSSAAPSSGLTGDAITLTGTPFTTTWDTAIYLGNVRAEVTSVDREGCDDCDECREDEGCTACDDCDACDAQCSSECVETAQFLVPEITPGTTSVRLLNSRGTSAPVDFLVLGDGTDTADSGAGDDTADSGSGHTGDTSAHTGDTSTTPTDTGAHTGDTSTTPTDTSTHTGDTSTTPTDTSAHTGDTSTSAE